MSNEITWEKELDEKGNVIKVTLVKKESKPLKEAEPEKEAK